MFLGDFRQLQSIVRALGTMIWNSYILKMLVFHCLTFDDKFASRLDTENDYLIPFRNGVLDLEQLRLRPGRPDDMVCKGPK